MTLVVLCVLMLAGALVATEEERPGASALAAGAAGLALAGAFLSMGAPRLALAQAGAAIAIAAILLRAGSADGVRGTAAGMRAGLGASLLFAVLVFVAARGPLASLLGAAAPVVGHPSAGRLAAERILDAAVVLAALGAARAVARGRRNGGREPGEGTR